MHRRRVPRRALFSWVSLLRFPFYNSDSILEPEIQRRRIRKPLLNLREMVQVSLHALREVMIAEHQNHGPVIRTRHNLQVVRIAHIHLGYLLAQGPKFVHEANEMVDTLAPLREWLLLYDAECDRQLEPAVLGRLKNDPVGIDEREACQPVRVRKLQEGD